MSDILQYVEDEQTSEFYPTPPSLIQKMIEGINFDYVETILEPSAGKGDILRELARKDEEFRYSEGKFDVDCIELDPNLRQILKYNFSDERKQLLRHRIYDIENSRVYDSQRHRYNELSDSQKSEIKSLEDELKTIFKKGIHVIHDDFLTYKPYKQYDVIIMNPPFSNGERHLLKALKIQERGGNIVCLLNAETLRNPFTETRRELLRQLNKYNAQIEYIENAFIPSERRTGVEVALIKVAIEKVQDESDIYNRMKEAEEMQDFIPEDETSLEVSEYIKAAVSQFNVEVKAGIELIRQYKAMIPYMSRGFGDESYDKEPILRLTDSYERGYESVSVNGFLQAVRHKYWKALLSNEKFIGKLTSKLQKEYRERVNKLIHYDFTEFNIRTLLAEMNTQIKKGIEDEIVAMFDRLTEEHSWYPECQKNKHYYDGWKTNKAHKIDKKVIIPCYGVFDSWDGKPRVYEAKHILEDIERILNFLDGHMTAEVDSWNTLEYYFKNGNTKNVPMKYYKATFYKKRYGSFGLHLPRIDSEVQYLCCTE